MTHRRQNSSKVSRRGWAISRSVSQALSDRALKRDLGALSVIDPELGAGVLAEVEFGQIAVGVLFLDMLGRCRRGRA